jgi:hypothetical protein
VYRLPEGYVLLILAWQASRALLFVQRRAARALASPPGQEQNDGTEEVREPCAKKNLEDVSCCRSPEL